MNKKNLLEGNNSIINLTENQIVNTSSAGLALQGIFLSTDGELILKERLPLVDIEKTVDFINPSLPEIDRTEEFRSKNSENLFKQGIEKFGSSIELSAQGGILFGTGIVSGSTDFSRNTNQEVTITNNKTNEGKYYSRVQYVVIPTKTCILNPNIIRLNQDALEELKRIDTILTNPNSEQPASNACKEFLNTYGSHALLGRITFGGIYWISANCSEFTSFEEEKLQESASKMIASKFGINVATLMGAGEGKGNIANHTDNQSQTVNTKDSLEVKIKLEVDKFGGVETVDNLVQWKELLITNQDKWAVIDRQATQLLGVWEIICRHHINEFKNPERLTKLLHQEWTKKSNLKHSFTYFVDKITELNQKTNLLLNQDIFSYYQNTLEGIEKLIEYKKEVKNKTQGNNYWVEQILSDKKIQDFLKYVFYNQQNQYGNNEVKEKLLKLLLSDNDYLDLDAQSYSQLKEVFNWINQRDKTVNLPESTQIHNLTDLINYIEQIITSLLKTQNQQPEDYLKPASLLLSRAINELRNNFQEQDKINELYLLASLLPLGNIFEYEGYWLNKKILEINNYQELIKILEAEKKDDLGIEATDLNLDKREANLILKILNADIPWSERENQINFINSILVPNLQSESVKSILIRYNVGLSYQQHEAVEELKNVINPIPKVETGTGINGILTQTQKGEPLNNDSQPIEPNQVSLSSELEKLLESLGLSEYYPNKLGREEVYTITEYSLEQSSPKTTEELAKHFITNLISFNYEGRELKVETEQDLTDEENSTGISEFTGNNSQSKKDTQIHPDPQIHPNDVIAAIFLCCNPIIRQDLVQRMFSCKLAIPLMIQEENDKLPQFYLWAMRSLLLKWKKTEKERTNTEELNIANYPVENIGFIRFNSSQISKSSLLNWIISEKTDKSHSIFFHRILDGSNRNRGLSEGMLEIAWYLPQGTEKDKFQDIVSFTNLRGDARKYPQQLKLIEEMAAKVVILASAEELKAKEAQIIENLLRAGKVVIILITDVTLNKEKEDCVNNFIASNQFKEYIDKQLITLRIDNITTITEEKEQKIVVVSPTKLRDKVRVALKKIKIGDNLKISLEEVAQKMANNGIQVDEFEEHCQTGIEQAERLLKVIQKEDIQQRKEKLLPLQGRLWAEWAEAEKEVYRLEKIGQEKDQKKYITRQEERKIKSRKQQFETVKNNLSEAIKIFLSTLLNQDSTTQEYFVRYLKLGLDELSRQELSTYYSQYTELIQKMGDNEVKKEEKELIKSELDKLDQVILDGSFGLEHLLREIGQIYTAVMARPKSERGDVSDLQRLPEIAANLLLKGYPLEIMDGDVSSIPVEWVEAVLKVLNQILKQGEKEKSPRLYTLSAMGIQSSGKSTLLNTMLGLQFAVSAGRCTKGVYLQPVKLEQKLRDRLKVDYIFVIDTEGLKSPELSGKFNRSHDNQLSTFVIGLSNLSLIKLPGENTTYLQEILPICLYAFLRMNDVNLSPKIKIVHRNADKSSQEKLNTQNRILNENLDKYTKMICEEDKREVKTFKEIIDFNLSEDVEYLPSLYEGDDYRNPVIPKYSTEVRNLKQTIINNAKSESRVSIAGFIDHLNTLWDAVKKENFVFYFNNTIEIQARGKLDVFWNKIHYDFEQQITHFENETYTIFANCTSEEELSNIHTKRKKELSNLVEQIYIEQEQILKDFFESSKGLFEDAMQQWESNTLNRLRDLRDELERKANKQIDGYENTRRMELTIDNEVLNYEDIIRGEIRTFVQEEKDRRQEEVLNLSEEELKLLFDTQWYSWIAELQLNYRNPRQKADVESDILKILREDYNKFGTQIREKIYSVNNPSRNPSKKNKFELRNLNFNNFYIQKEHYEIDNVNDLKNRWENLNKLQFQKAFQNHEQQAREKIELFKNRIFDYINQYLQEKEHSSNLPYRDTYIREMLREVTEKIEKESQRLLNETSFRLTQDFEIDLLLAVCGYVIERLERIDQRFREAQNPILKIEQQKQYYFDIFQVSFNQENAQSAIASHLLRVFLEGIVEKIKQELADEIYTQMKSITHSQILNDKQSLIASVLISLAEKGSLNDYIKYIHNPEESIKTWIAKYVDEFNSEDSGIENIIKKQIEDLVYIANDSIEKTNRYIENNPQDSNNIQTWIEKFRELAENRLIFRNLEKVETFGNEIDNIDFDYIKAQISTGLDKEQSSLPEELCDFSKSETEQYSYLRSNVVDKIITSVIGCIEACPFCGEICIVGRDNHDSDHETPYHRPDGVKGYRPVSGSPKLTTETCPQNVAGNGTFKNSDTNEEYIPYKDYRQVNDYYRSWKIHGDVSLEASSYWKWFMATYSSELAKDYDAEEPDIDSSWKSLTKEKEIEKLRKIIQGDE